MDAFVTSTIYVTHYIRIRRSGSNRTKAGLAGYKVAERSSDSRPIRGGGGRSIENFENQVSKLYNLVVLCGGKIDFF